MATGDFTNIRVESRSYDTATLYFDYGLTGTNAVTVWRSPQGAATWTQLANFPTDYESSGGTMSPFQDSTVAASTYYDYALSDDAGATKTTAVAVQSQKQFPYAPNHPYFGTGSRQQVELSNFAKDEDITPENLQKVVEDLKNVLNSETVSAPRSCIVCPSNGAVVLDCSTGCYRFIIEDTDITDINSISSNCSRTEIDFNVPDGTTIEVCGWPEESESTGDECYQAPVAGPGVTGFGVSRKKQTCPNTRYRIPSYPCGEYTQDCYDSGSLAWTGTKYNYSLTDCGSGTGCCSGNNGHVPAGTGSALVRSGLIPRNGDYQQMAGFSLLYGRSGGTPGLPWDIEYYLLAPSSAVIGSPIYGMAFNVTEGSTVENFTGDVFLLDYNQSLAIVGQYSAANLHNGDLPTTVTSGALPASIGKLGVLNYPSVASSFYIVYNAAGGTALSLTNAGLTAPSNNLIGVGFIWVANTTPPSVVVKQHAGSMGWNTDGTTPMSIFPS